MEQPIFNFLNRHSVYVEGVKNWQAQDFKRYLKLLSDAIRDYLAKLGVKTLGELSRSKFAALLKRINTRVGEVLGNFSGEWLTELKRFTYIDTTMQKSAWAVLKPKVDLTSKAGASVWSSVKDRVVPAFGQKVSEQLSDFVAIAKDSLRKRVNTGFANNEAVDEVSNEVTSLTAKTFSSVLQQVGNRARGLMATAIQHATATVSDALNSLIFDCYRWVSVLDSRTSEYCRDQNGRVYRNGAGPLPPAHNFCRSRTVPVDCGDDNKSPVPTFFSWLLTQSKDFLTDAFGDSVAARVEDGTLKQGEVPDFAALKALSLDDFELKTVYLTTRNGA